MQPFTSKSAMLKAALGLAACLVVTGCNSYSHMTRSDKISPAAGDAVYAARTMQTVDPWPEYVLDTDITYGRRTGPQAGHRLQGRQHQAIGRATFQRRQYRATVNLVLSFLA
jgi:hypothetical protein